MAGIDPLTAYLATTPGGSDAVAIIAASSEMDLLVSHKSPPQARANGAA